MNKMKKLHKEKNKSLIYSFKDIPTTMECLKKIIETAVLEEKLTVAEFAKKANLSTNTMIRIANYNPEDPFKSILPQFSTICSILTAAGLIVKVYDTETKRSVYGQRYVYNYLMDVYNELPYKYKVDNNLCKQPGSPTQNYSFKLETVFAICKWTGLLFGAAVNTTRKNENVICNHDVAEKTIPSDNTDNTTEATTADNNVEIVNIEVANDVIDNGLISVIKMDEWIKINHPEIVTEYCRYLSNSLMSDIQNKSLLQIDTGMIKNTLIYFKGLGYNDDNLIKIEAAIKTIEMLR
jgi:hypothetical protein